MRVRRSLAGRSVARVTLAAAAALLFPSLTSAREPSRASLPGIATGVPGGSARWAWLEGTTWYVPTANLPAVEYDPATGAVAPILDQTVYRIERYADGYFWGTTAVQLLTPTGDGPDPSTPFPLCLDLVGSVTPEGSVQLSFTPSPASRATRSTSGAGTMRWRDGEWTMENQMSTGSSTQVTHWAYMLQCRAGEPCAATLPGVAEPEERFIARCAR